MIRQHFLSTRLAGPRRERASARVHADINVHVVCVLCGWRLWCCSKVGVACGTGAGGCRFHVASMRLRLKPRHKSPSFPSAAAVGHMRGHVCRDYCHALGHEGLAAPVMLHARLLTPGPPSAGLKTVKHQSGSGSLILPVMCGKRRGMASACVI